MQFNPYTPPSTTTTLTHDSKVSRPVSVWLLLIFAATMVVLNAVGSGRVAVFLISRWGEVKNLPMLAFAFAWRAALCGTSLAVLLGIYRRRQWGRWLGILILAVAATTAYLKPDTTTYSNTAQRSGGFVGRYVLVPLLLSWWAYAFGFSAKGRRYFSPASASTEFPGAEAVAQRAENSAAPHSSLSDEPARND